MTKPTHPQPPRVKLRALVRPADAALFVRLFWNEVVKRKGPLATTKLTVIRFTGFPRRVFSVSFHRFPRTKYVPFRREVQERLLQLRFLEVTTMAPKLQRPSERVDEEMIQNLQERRDQVLSEIDEYNKERDRIRTMLGRIGGKSYSKKDMVINIVFLIVILTLFTLELTTKFLPAYISIEISVLLVSIKIVWMIHSQHRFNHFQFWVLNSIEFRVNDMQKRVSSIERSLDNGDAASSEGSVG